MAIFSGETYDTRRERREQLPDLGSEGNSVPFSFIFSPASWECVDLEAFGVPESDRSHRFEWIPRLKKFHHRAGVNGVSQRSGGLGRALGEYREKGWLVLEPEHGPEGRSYVSRVRTRRGDRFVDAWTSFLKAGIGGRIALRFDDLGYLQWRRSLVRDGVIPLPPEEVIESQIEPVQQEISRLENRAHLPHVQTQIAYLSAKLEGMRAKVFPAEPEKPSRRARK